MAIITAKLSQLRLSPLNQRRIKPSAIESMADDIHAHGLLQNLVAYEEDGLLWVFAGGRRYRGLKELVKRKKVRNSDLFPVEVRSKEEAIELSLAENFQREDMHPADSIRAFAALRDTGMDAEEIAARFGQAVSFVYKMLRFSALAPVLIDLIAKDQLSLEAARALTVQSFRLDATQADLRAEKSGRKTDRESYARAQAEAMVQAVVEKSKVEMENAKDRELAQAGYDALRERYAGILRTKAAESSGGGTDLSRPGERAGVHADRAEGAELLAGAGAAIPFGTILIPQEDALICAENTAFAQGAHGWALTLPSK